MKKREVENLLFWWFENSVPDLVSTISEIDDKKEAE